MIALQAIMTKREGRAENFTGRASRKGAYDGGALNSTYAEKRNTRKKVGDFLLGGVKRYSRTRLQWIRIC